MVGGGWLEIKDARRDKECPTPRCRNVGEWQIVSVNYWSVCCIFMKQAKEKSKEQQGEVDAGPEIGRQRVSLMDVAAWSHRYKCGQVLHYAEDNMLDSK